VAEICSGTNTKLCVVVENKTCAFFFSISSTTSFPSTYTSSSFVFCFSSSVMIILLLHHETFFLCHLHIRRSGNRIPVGKSFTAPVQTGPGAHPASCTMGTGSFPGVKYGRGVLLTTHPFLALWSWKSRAILLPPYGPKPGL
jgi:hypothetical protein